MDKETMFNLVELRNLATDKKYSTVRVASKELLSLINEIELLREQLFNAEQQIYRVEKEQLATVTAERDELAAALKIACDYAREYEDCPFIEGEAALAKVGAGKTKES